ncbi:hypothetical protein CYMTET_13375 [Cymbomonas tetramitiformis]|uniref:N-acetyltransferase domain-containing protein n=1 Tax=Cymbomonas tetramitiformis TaxID=36881 RepID=A0AAE0GIA0_9CHLO|nr:hypothetical protein CYMTET_13375 [Cymbomonas tetramitiformis]
MLDQSQVVVRESEYKDDWQVADCHCNAFVGETLQNKLSVTRWPLRAARVLRSHSLRSKNDKRTPSSYAPSCANRQACFIASHASFAEKGEEPPAFMLAVVRAASRATAGDTASEAGETTPEGDFAAVAGVISVDTMTEFLPEREGGVPSSSWGKRRYHRRKIAYVSDVAVQPGARRLGIASVLLKKAEATAASWGCRCVALHVDEANEGAFNMYKQAGYRKVAYEKGAHDFLPRRRSSLMMIKRLSQHMSNAQVE